MKMMQLGAATIAIFAVVLVVPATATVLTFQSNQGNWSALDQTYGDNVSGSPDPNGHQYAMGNGWTPNVEVGYSAYDRGPDESGEVHYASDGEWPEVAYLLPAGLVQDQPWEFWFTFTPDAGYGVEINSFVLDPYGATDIEVDWTIFADSVGGAVLDSGTTGVFNSNTAFASTMSAYVGTVVLEIDQTGGPRTYLSLDDLNFDQSVIPEPSSVVLLLMAGLSVALKGRTRRRI